MIRIDFSPVDLGRVTLASEPDPLWEAALAARALRDLPSSPTARQWRRDVQPQLRPTMRPLLELIRPDGKFPDFLTPDLDGGDLDDALERLMATPADVIRAELSHPRAARREGLLNDLMDDRLSARRDLCRAIRSFNGALRSWSPIPERRFAADLAVRTQAMLSEGVEETLASLHPDIQWQAPALLLHRMDPLVCRIDLAGRGLMLYPSALVADCITLNVAGRRPMLVYPATETVGHRLTNNDYLADLLGRTRAAVLTSLTMSANTTQLARRIGISLASASEHTQVLRNAGLVTTQRAGGLAVHSLTPAGKHLLHWHQGQRRA